MDNSGEQKGLNTGISVNRWMVRVAHVKRTQNTLQPSLGQERE